MSSEKPIYPSRVQASLDDLESEIVLIRNLLFCLVEQHPNKTAVVHNFKHEVEGFCRHAPPGTSEDFRVEVMARLQLYLQALS